MLYTNLKVLITSTNTTYMYMYRFLLKIQTLFPPIKIYEYMVQVVL
jgi:hypothetical protein